MSVRSYNKNLAHLIWSTQNREKLLADKQLRKELSQYYYDCSVEKDNYMKINYVNTEHVHTLIHLPANLRLIKLSGRVSIKSVDSSREILPLCFLALSFEFFLLLSKACSFLIINKRNQFYVSNR